MTTLAPALSGFQPESDDFSAAAYPRPLLRRELSWQSLNGAWAFALGQATARHPDEVDFAQTIQVPFAPECPASGVAARETFDTCWYRREFELPELAEDERLLLHFEAVDDVAELWMNGAHAGRVSGPCRQTLDITALLRPDGAQVLAVRVFDDPHDMTKPRGKQEWQDQPHAIWYPRTTGLWQTVWLERVPASHVSGVRWAADLARWEIELDVQVAGAAGVVALEVDLFCDGKRLIADRYAVTGSQVRRCLGLPDPGIDDARNALLWSPGRPNLIDAELRLIDAQGRTVDRVASYAALRTVEVSDGRFLINGRPWFLRLVLAQGYWPDTGLTPPSDAALRADVALVKELGFNGVRLHQKVECERYLYWADKLGLLVWGEMGSSYAFSPTGWARVQEQWTQRVLRDVSHPCIIAWVPVNESWGLPDLPRDAQQRSAQAAIYHLTHALDPTRPVIANDGWEMGATDVIAIHDYDGDPQRVAARYARRDGDWTPVLMREWPGYRKLLLPGHTYAGQPVMLSEFGGIALQSGPGHDGWGYTAATTPAQFEAQYAALLRVVNAVPGLAGFCYTQFTDTYQEINGLLTMQRVPKLPLDRLAAATLGRLDAEAGS